MAYPYYPNYTAWNAYNPLLNQQAQPQPQQPASGIVWVQGETDAKARPVLSGQSAIFMDSEEPLMYIKTVDASGMPQPLRVFEYKERITQTKREQNVSASETDHVTRQEFDALVEKVAMLTGEGGEG